MSTTGQESLQAGREALAAYAKRVKPDTLLKVAAEIVAVRDVFAGEARLRRALTDPGREAADRAGLAEQVLSGKVSAGALKIIVTLVKGRWSTPGELQSALESLAADALLTAGAAGGALADIEDELFRFARLCEGDANLGSVLGNSGGDVAGRAQIVDSLLSGKANTITVQLVKMAVAGFGGRGFEASLASLLELTSAKREQRLAYVTVATPLPEDQETRLANRLAEIYGQPVQVLVTVDPTVIGGIRVQIGYDLFDGTVARRLTEARKALVGGR